MNKPRTIVYTSAVWDIKTASLSSALLSIQLYEATKPTGIIVWLPGMSDKPIAGRDNPLLSYFIPRALKKSFSVAVVCFPGTFDSRFIEERTLSTMRQNVRDAIGILSKRIINYSNLKKILVGRSAGGTLVASYLTQNFDIGISIAGRLKLTDLYRDIRKKFGKRTYYPINSKYSLNEQYVKELGLEEKLITQSFRKANKNISLVAIQAKDDDIVPYQLDRWKELAEQNKIPITLYPLTVQCGHSYITQPAIRLVTQKILSTI